MHLDSLRSHDAGLALENPKLPDEHDEGENGNVIAKVLFALALFAVAQPVGIERGLWNIEAALFGETERLKKLIFGTFWMLEFQMLEIW
jgi:hypothetical protein